MPLIVVPDRITGKVTAEVNPKVTSSATGAVTKEVATNANGVIDSNLSLGHEYYTKEEINNKGFITRSQMQDEFVEKKNALTNIEIDNLLTND